MTDLYDYCVKSFCLGLTLIDKIVALGLRLICLQNLSLGIIVQYISFEKFRI